MKYMLLMQSNTKTWDSFDEWSKEDIQVMVEFMDRFNADLTKSGEWIDGQGLGGPRFAKIVHADKDGEPVVTDGPFPEAKEFLAGFWIVDVATPERAIELAVKVSTCPGPGGAPGNTPVEVHPVMEGPLVED